MPYIKQKIREKVDEKIEPLANSIIAAAKLYETYTDGIMNYTITKLIGEVYGPIENLKYTDFNEIIGILECCKLEFYRKAAAPYEDLKERENGPVLDGKRVENNKIKDFSRQTPVSKNIIPSRIKFIEYPLGLRPELSINDITGEDVKRIWNRVVEDKEELEVGIFMTILKPGITTFIKANSYKLAYYILLNEILTSKEYADIEYHSTVSMLKLYNKSYEDLEPAIKNAFIAKARDGLNDNFVIFIKNTGRKQ